MKKYGDLRDRFYALRWAWEHQQWLEKKESNKAYDFASRAKSFASEITWPQIAASYERYYGKWHEAAYFERTWRRRNASNKRVKAKNGYRLWP